MPLKVLNLASTPGGIGGVESLLLSAVDKYDTRRFDVSFCNLFDAGGEDSVFPAGLRARGARYLEVPGSGWRDLPTLVARLVALLRRERFDVLHSHMLHATIVGHLAARIAGVPVRIASRQYTGEAFQNKRAWVRALDRRAFRTATHVVAVSRAVRDTLVHEDGIAPERISVVHNSIDLAAIDAARLDSPLPWPPDWEEKLLLGYTASLTWRKDHANLLRAFARVLAEEPRARLVLVGEGPERGSLQALAAELQVADRVLFTGRRSDVPALARHFHLYVHPPLHEPFGIAVAEAMAVEKPVVGTSVGGIPEVVGEDAGLLVPPGDPAALASAILRVVRDPPTAARMGQHGRQRAERHFAVEVTVERYQELYSRFANGGRS
ncbi:MAG: glycosyltransferase [Gemmatimonadetes bacterium]|nr:glycosyltransferase [Gemmatimonadota bacterium]